MTERSPNFDRFKQHTYTPNAYYDELNLVRVAMVDATEADFTVDFITDPPEHSAADINAALDDDVNLTFEFEIEVQLIDSISGDRLPFNGELSLRMIEDTMVGDGSAEYEDGTLPGVDTVIEMVDGYGSVTVVYSKTAVGDQWAAGDQYDFVVGENVATDDDEIYGTAVAPATLEDVIQA